MSLSNGPAALAEYYGPLELRVMECVWRSAPTDVRSVQAAIVRAGHDAAYNTVRTVMERLARKGELVRDREGRQFVYSPVRSRAETQTLVAQGSVDDLLDRHGDLAVSFFVDRARRDPARLERLRELVRQLETEGGGDG